VLTWWGRVGEWEGGERTREGGCDHPFLVRTVLEKWGYSVQTAEKSPARDSGDPVSRFKFKSYRLRLAFPRDNTAMSREETREIRRTVAVPLLRFSDSEMKDWREKKKKEKERERTVNREYTNSSEKLGSNNKTKRDSRSLENLRIEAEKEIKLDPPPFDWYRESTECYEFYSFRSFLFLFFSYLDACERILPRARPLSLREFSRNIVYHAVLKSCRDNAESLR
jgi:hypothetical protein